MLELSVAILKADVFKSAPTVLVAEIVVLKGPAKIDFPETTPAKELIDKPVKYMLIKANKTHKVLIVVV